MQGNEKLFCLALFCIIVISIYPANAQYKCLEGDADLDTSTNKTTTAPTALKECGEKVAFCMTEDKNGNYDKSIRIR